MAQKVVTKTGKVRYLSAVLRDRNKHKKYQDEDGSFWADWKPKHNLGKFVNEPCHYKHNGEIKSLFHVVYIGRNPAKFTRQGWKEISAMHLGHGVWMFTLEKRKEKYGAKNKRDHNGSRRDHNHI